MCTLTLTHMGTRNLCRSLTIFLYMIKYINYKLSTLTIIQNPSARIWSEGGGKGVPVVIYKVSRTPSTHIWSKGGGSGACSHFALSLLRSHTPYTPHEQSLMVVVGGAGCHQCHGVGLECHLFVILLLVVLFPCLVPPLHFITIPPSSSSALFHLYSTL